MPDSSPPIPYLFITTVVVPLAGLLGGLMKAGWDHIKKKGERSVAARAIEVDDEVQLRRDLIAERKMLLEQLINERTGYQAEVGELKKELSALGQSVRTLQMENLEKDRKLLDQQGKINEQEILIKSLRTELDELKSHEQTTH